MNLAHLHLLLNHFPTIGTIIGVGLFLIALLGRSDDLKRASLAIFLGIALLTIPVYVSGNAASEVICHAPLRSACPDPSVSRAMILAHETAAFLALGLMELLGAFAWLGLWQYRRLAHLPTWNLVTVLVLSIATCLMVAYAANFGGVIRHPEVRSGQEVLTISPTLARRVGAFIAGGVPWGWAVCETLHFVGLSLLFGVALVIDLRVLGMMKSVSFAALHRLMPWGILGFGMNLVTGMLFFVAASDQYTTNIVFQWKLALMMLAGINVLYFTMFDDPWDLKPGDNATVISKAVAASSIFLVLGVLYCGRMLPFLGKSF